MVRRSVLHKPVQWLMRPIILFRKKYPQDKWVDTVIVSFPKSGRTWFRVFLSSFFVHSYGSQYSLDFAPIFKIKKDVPRIIFDHGGHFDFGRKNIHKRIESRTGKRVVLLVRDPRDVVVSYFYEVTKRDGKELKWGGDMSSFIRDENFGIGQVISFMNEWYKHKDVFSDIYIVMYENLKLDPKKYFGEALQFMNLPGISEEALKKAVDFSSFENMRKLEEDDFYVDPRLRAREKGNESTYKTRKGKIGGYKSALSKEDLAYVNTQMKKLDSRFGYSV